MLSANPASHLLSDLASEVISQWPLEERFEVEAVLRAHPELGYEPELIRKLALEEYCRCCEESGRVDAERFVQRYPECRSALLNDILIVSYLQRNVDAVERLADSIAWPQAGDVYLGWPLIEELGRGGFSRVYLATEPEVGNRQIVVKATSARQTEASVVSAIDHPGIVRVLSVRLDELRGFTAVAMPYLGRATLLDGIDAALRVPPPARAAAMWSRIDQLNASAPVSHDDSLRGVARGQSYEATVLTLGARVADALAAAHAAGLLHCDLKPSNLLIARNGAPIVIDFNLAVSRDANPVAGGTLPYMAPEQLDLLLGQKNAPVSELSDIYQLGSTLHHALCGRPPKLPSSSWGKEPLVEGARRFRQQTRENLLEQLGLGKPVERLLTGCLAEDPQQRPQSMRELSDRLLEAAASLSGERTLSRRIGSIVRHRRFGWRSFVAPAAVAAVVGWRAMSSPERDNTPPTLSIAPRTAMGFREQLADAFAAGDLERADRLMEEAPAGLHPGEAEALKAFSLQERDGAVNEIQRLYLEAMRLGVATPQLKNNLALSLLDSNELAQGIGLLREAVAEDPDLCCAWYNLSQAEMRAAVQARLAPDPASIERALSCDRHPEIVEHACRVYAWRCKLDASGADADSLARLTELLEIAIANGPGPGFADAVSGIFAPVRPLLESAPPSSGPRAPLQRVVQPIQL